MPPRAKTCHQVENEALIFKEKRYLKPGTAACCAATPNFFLPVFPTTYDNKLKFGGGCLWRFCQKSSHFLMVGLEPFAGFELVDCNKTRQLRG